MLGAGDHGVVVVVVVVVAVGVGNVALCYLVFVSVVDHVVIVVVVRAALARRTTHIPFFFASVRPSVWP